MLSWEQMVMVSKRPIGPWVKGYKDGHQVALAKNSTQRSITPPGFAKAFFEANP